MNFQIVPVPEGFIAHIVSDDGEYMFTSPPCKTKIEAKGLIALVQNAAAHAEIEDRTRQPRPG